MPSTISRNNVVRSSDLTERAQRSINTTKVKRQSWISNYTNHNMWSKHKIIVLTLRSQQKFLKWKSPLLLRVGYSRHIPCDIEKPHKLSNKPQNNNNIPSIITQVEYEEVMTYNRNSAQNKCK